MSKPWSKSCFALILLILGVSSYGQDVPATGIVNGLSSNPEPLFLLQYTLNPQGQIFEQGGDNNFLLTASAVGANNANVSPQGVYTLTFTPATYNARIVNPNGTPVTNGQRFPIQFLPSDIPATGQPDVNITANVSFTHTVNGQSVTVNGDIGTIRLFAGGSPPPPPPPPPNPPIAQVIRGWALWNLKFGPPPPVKIPIPLSNHQSYTKGPHFMKRRLHLRDYRRR